MLVPMLITSLSRYMNLENLQITLDYKCSCCYYVFVVRKNFSWYVEAYFVIQLVRAV